MTRVLALLGLVLGLCLVAAPPAAAHAGGLTPRDDHSAVTAIVPALAGVRAAMVNNSTQLELRNDGHADLVVLTDPPRKVRPGEVLRYRDERTAWRDTGSAVQDWRIPLRVNGMDATLVGRVEVRDAPPLAAWLAVTAGFAVAGWLLGRVRWWRPGLAIGVVVVTAANIVHAAGSALAVTGQSFLPLMVGASGVGLVCWPLALVAVVAVARRSTSTAFVAAIVGAMLVVAGIPDFDSFRYPVLPFDGPAAVDRLLVAITLGGGVGLAVGGFAATRRVVQLSTSEGEKA